VAGAPAKIRHPGEVPLVSSRDFKDKGLKVAGAEVGAQKAGKGYINVDPNCVGCSNKNNDVIMKHFKTACLGYAPNPVVFRNKEFERQQLLAFRKYILGECCKVVI